MATKLSDDAIREYTTGVAGSIYMTSSQAERWNDGDFTEEDAASCRCVVPTSEPDRSYVRDGEVVYRPGLPTTWEGTLAECEREHPEWYEDCFADRAVKPVGE